MFDNSYLNNIRNDLLESLQLLIDHINNNNTDAYEFHSDRIEHLTQAISLIRNNFNILL